MVWYIKKIEIEMYKDKFIILLLCTRYTLIDNYRYV